MSTNLPIKKSTTAPKSSPPTASAEGFHHQSGGRGSFEESGAHIGSKRRSSPDLAAAGSSPITSQSSFRPSNSPHHHHHRHHSPNAVRRNTVSGPAPSVDSPGHQATSGNIHQLPRLCESSSPYYYCHVTESPPSPWFVVLRNMEFVRKLCTIYAWCIKIYENFKFFRLYRNRCGSTNFAGL